MPKIQYISKRFSPGSVQLIEQADEIITDYQAQGFNLTLRQLYYQFVARDLFPSNRMWSWTGSRWVKDPKGTKNADPNYKWLGGIVNDARLAGLLDWEAIVDRSRSLNRVSSWEDPGDIVQACADSYAIDLWDGQECRVEVWVEKEALGEIVEEAAKPMGVSSFACKGYSSQSAMWEAAQRFQKYRRRGYTPVIIHLGDHDPSGIDMTRDIRDRMSTFGIVMEVNRIALNMDQVKKYGPPPDPAKLTDSRAEGYIAEFGYDSWELDALEPAVLRDLIQDAIKEYLDQDEYDAREEQQEKGRGLLTRASSRWDEVVRFLNKKKKGRK